MSSEGIIVCKDSANRAHDQVLPPGFASAGKDIGRGAAAGGTFRRSGRGPAAGAGFGNSVRARIGGKRNGGCGPDRSVP